MVPDTEFEAARKGDPLTMPGAPAKVRAASFSRPFLPFTYDPPAGPSARLPVLSPSGLLSPSVPVPSGSLRHAPCSMPSGSLPSGAMPSAPCAMPPVPHAFLWSPSVCATWERVRRNGSVLAAPPPKIPWSMTLAEVRVESRLDYELLNKAPRPDWWPGFARIMLPEVSRQTANAADPGDPTGVLVYGRTAPELSLGAVLLARFGGRMFTGDPAGLAEAKPNQVVVLPLADLAGTEILRCALAGDCHRIVVSDAGCAEEFFTRAAGIRAPLAYRILRSSEPRLWREAVADLLGQPNDCPATNYVDIRPWQTLWKAPTEAKH